MQGLLAVEGTYDRIEAMMKSKMHPCDIILCFALEEGDEPKIEELLKAGADMKIKDLAGKDVWQIAEKNEKSMRALKEFTATKKA